jgi:hypothetical protein
MLLPRRSCAPCCAAKQSASGLGPQENDVRTFGLIAVTLGALLMSSAVEAASRPPENPANPAAQGPADAPLTAEGLRRRLQDACVQVLASQPQAEPAKMSSVSRCGCYAGSMMKSLNANEVEELKATGGFTGAARAKAEQALATCKIKV